MITLATTLRKSAIKTDLEASTGASAMFEVASLLRHDERVKDWPALFESLGDTANCIVDEAVSAICLPHARTEAVKTIVIAAGRSSGGILFPNCEKPVRYLFVIGVPKTMASEYLRIVGALLRIIRQDAVERALRACATAGEFQEILAEEEMKL